MIINKHECLERARKHVEIGSSESLRYAALELRLFMECVTYDKLKAMSSQIPAHAYERLLPPQAVRLLLEFDPGQDKEYTLYIGLEEQYGKPAKEMKYLGTHKPVRLAWLRKHYNKIGQQLHVLSPTQQGMPKDKLTEYLWGVIEEMTEVATGNITGGLFGNVGRFECQVCNTLIICSEHKVTSSNLVTCHNHSCRAEYYATLSDDGQFKFDLKVTEFDCIDCQAKTKIQNRDLKIGAIFACANCGSRHEFVNRQWGYRLLPDPPE